jgi:hypothetical protein
MAGTLTKGDGLKLRSKKSELLHSVPEGIMADVEELRSLRLASVGHGESLSHKILLDPLSLIFVCLPFQVIFYRASPMPKRLQLLR